MRGAPSCIAPLVAATEASSPSSVVTGGIFERSTQPPKLVVKFSSCARSCSSPRTRIRVACGSVATGIGRRSPLASRRRCCVRWEQARWLVRSVAARTSESSASFSMARTRRDPIQDGNVPTWTDGKTSARRLNAWEQGSEQNLSRTYKVLLLRLSPDPATKSVLPTPPSARPRRPRQSQALQSSPRSSLRRGGVDANRKTGSAATAESAEDQTQRWIAAGSFHGSRGDAGRDLLHPL